MLQDSQKRNVLLLLTPMRLQDMCWACTTAANEPAAEVLLQMLS